MLASKRQKPGKIIGTQGQVNTSLVDAFMGRFLPVFLRQTPLGQALFQARQSLLHHQLDPRPLTYSLFAAAEVQLAQPVIE